MLRCKVASTVLRSEEAVQLDYGTLPACVCMAAVVVTKLSFVFFAIPARKPFVRLHGLIVAVNSSVVAVDSAFAL